MSRLTLYPSPPTFRLADTQTLGAVLRDANLLGAPYPAAGTACYLAGAAFLDFIMFLGCSPQIQTRPAPDEPLRRAPNFYYLELPPGFDRPRFLGGEFSRPPRCLQCKGVDKDWPTHLARWQHSGQAADFAWFCPHCGAISPFCELDWRQTAGFAQAALHVWGVFEGEAVPGENLLNLLAHTTGAAWSYCYA